MAACLRSHSTGGDTDRNASDTGLTCVSSSPLCDIDFHAVSHKDEQVTHGHFSLAIVVNLKPQDVGTPQTWLMRGLRRAMTDQIHCFGPSHFRVLH